MTKKQITSTSIILAVSIIVSVLCGIIASVATQRSLDSYLESLSDEDIVLSLSQVKPTAVPGTYEEALSAVLESSDSLAWVYPDFENGTNPNAWIYQSDAYGTGVVVTNDGWILLSSDVIATASSIDDMKVLIGSSWYTPTQLIDDTRFGASMLRVEASNLRAVSFAQSEQAKLGEFAFAFTGIGDLIVSSFKNTQWYQKESSRPAEIYASLWLLQDEISDGSLLFDSSGDLLGIGKTGKEAYPIHALKSFVQSTLSGAPCVYPALGAYVISLEQGMNIDVAKLGTSKGFMVARMPGFSSAFVANSPARASGIKEYDVIVSVDGVQISSDYPLAQALEKYEVGGEVLLGIMRGGEAQEIKVILGEYNLLY